MMARTHLSTNTLRKSSVTSWTNTKLPKEGCMKISIAAMLALNIAVALPAVAQDRDALDVQKARNAHVAGRRDLVDYPPNTYDLSDLPAYKPQQQVSGVIRMTGSNYIADSHVGENWVAEFKKFQPGV